MSEQMSGRAKSAKVLAGMMTPEERTERAKKGATARWGEKPPQATHKGNFKKEFGIDVDCYVLNDDHKTAVISQRGMGTAIGLSQGSGSNFPRFINSKSLAPYLGSELRQKLENPLIFQGPAPGPGVPPVDKLHGFDVTILIDICKAIISAESDKKLKSNQSEIAKQAHIILSASAKAGIKGLVYALVGYSPNTQEVIDAFRAYILEEAKKYEKEFPTELYIEWQRLYNITPPQRGKNWKEMHLTVDHVYHPLAKSNGKLLELLRSVKTSGGNRGKKLFQFLNEVGTRALRIQLGRILEMAESSPDRKTYEEKIVQRFGGQLSLDIPTYPIS